MKTIILTAAAVAMTATTAFAGPVLLNSDGERKHGFAARIQVENGAADVDYSTRNRGGLDFTATQSLRSAPQATGRVSVRRKDDGNEGTIIEFSRINAEGKREVFRTVHQRS